MKRSPGTLAVLTALVLFLAPAAASAHRGNPNYRSEITVITPAKAADGLQMEIQNFDDHIELINRTGQEVVIKGYDGEPYVRISADGLVEVNLNSPSYYLNEDRFANVELPTRADAKAAPAWDEVDSTGRYVWHDHRSHYMGTDLPSQVKDKSVKTKVFDYVIPMTVGGKPVKAQGTLTWVGESSGFPVLPFILLAGLIVAAVVVNRLIRRRRGETDRPVAAGPGVPEDGENEAW